MTKKISFFFFIVVVKFSERYIERERKREMHTYRQRQGWWEGENYVNKFFQKSQLFKSYLFAIFLCNIFRFIFQKVAGL